MGEQNKPRNPEFQHRQRKSQPLWLKKPVGVKVVREMPNLTGEFVGETQRGLERAQALAFGNQQEMVPT